MTSHPCAFLIVFLVVAGVLAWAIGRGIDWLAERLGTPPDDDDTPPSGAVGVAA